MIALVALAGGLGAALRFVLDGVIRSATGGTYPIGTTVINLTGSLLLGVVTGLAVRGLVPEPWHLVVGTGLLGGYTTFSTAMVDVVTLARQARWREAVAVLLGTLVLAVVAASLGIWAATVL